jgi:GNAT superfamily N-acetyltransferase
MIEVYYESLTDLARRNNQPTPNRDINTTLKFYNHAMKKGIFYVATSNEKIVGFSGAIIRDNLWFLSAFWVLPEFQRKGIGFPIVQRVYNGGIEKGCTNFTVYASMDYPALSSYMKLGMYPGYPVFNFDGPVNLFNISDQKFKSYEIGNSSYDLDYNIRGVNRIIDHNYWKETGNKGSQIEINNKVIGFYYFRKGFIGPLVSNNKTYTELLLKIAINDSINHFQSNSIELKVPGVNHSALKFVLDNNFRIKSSAYFLFSKNFGDLQNYIPSSAGLY